MDDLKEYSRQRAQEREAEKRQALVDVKDPLSADAEFARTEIPRIDREFMEAVLWWKKETDGIDWEGIGGMPRSISDLVSALNEQGKNPGVLREMLKRYDGLTPEQCWGYRRDGQRDINQAANVRGSFNFLLTHGAVRRIRESRARLEFELAELNRRLSYNEQIGKSEKREAVTLKVPTPKSESRAEIDATFSVYDR